MIQLLCYQALWFSQEGQGGTGKKVVKETKINYCWGSLEDIKESKVANTGVFRPLNR